MTSHMSKEVGTLPEKPSMNDVLKYATDQVDRLLREKAAHLQHEHRDEVRQEALIRVAKAYAELDVTRGWKSFVQTHCKGAILDYLRAGTGFKESRWGDPIPEEADAADQIEPEEVSIEGEESEEAESALEALGEASVPDGGTGLPRPKKFKQRLHQRVTVMSSDWESTLDAESIAGIFGVHTSRKESGIFNPNWDLIARMAAVDPEILLIAKTLRGFSQTDMAPGFSVTRERLSQRIRLFRDRLDSPEFYQSPWTRQTIYAFGLEEFYLVPLKDRGDNGMGWNNEPIDLDSDECEALMTLFFQEEFRF